MKTVKYTQKVIYAPTHRHIVSHRNTDRDKHTHTHTQTETQTLTHKHTHTDSVTRKDGRDRGKEWK